MDYSGRVETDWLHQRELIADSLSPSDRVLILGGGGWFGQTFKLLVTGLAQVMSHNLRTSDQSDTDYRSQVEAFGPTVVANFAFLTPHFTRTMTQDAYVTTNRRIFERFRFAASLPSVRVALHASSGATTTPAERLGQEHRIYRELKHAEETAILSGPLAERCGIIRAFSVSGPFVRTPEKYAFSDMTGQALRGRILVRSDRPTFRRYCSVADLLAVAMARTSNSGGGLIESGGPLVEMRELATLISGVTMPKPSVSLTEWSSESPSQYASDDVSWTSACQAAGLTPMDLQQQIRQVQSYFLSEKAGD